MCQHDLTGHISVQRLVFAHEHPVCLSMISGTNFESEWGQLFPRRLTMIIRFGLSLRLGEQCLLAFKNRELKEGGGSEETPVVEEQGAKEDESFRGTERVREPEKLIVIITCVDTHSSSRAVSR